MDNRNKEKKTKGIKGVFRKLSGKDDKKEKKDKRNLSYSSSQTNDNPTLQVDDHARSQRSQGNAQLAQNRSPTARVPSPGLSPTRGRTTSVLLPSPGSRGRDGYRSHSREGSLRRSGSQESDITVDSFGSSVTSMDTMADSTNSLPDIDPLQSAKKKVSMSLGNLQITVALQKKKRSGSSSSINSTQSSCSPRQPRSSSSNSMRPSDPLRRRGTSAGSVDRNTQALPTTQSSSSSLYSAEPEKEKKRSRSLSKTASKGLKSISRSLRSISNSSSSISDKTDHGDQSKKKSPKSSSSDPSADILRNPKKKPISRQASSASIDKEALKSSRMMLPPLGPAIVYDTFHFATLEKKLADSGGELVMCVGPPGTPTSGIIKREEDEVFELPPEQSRGAPEGSEGLVTEEVTSMSDEEFEAFEKNEAFVDQLLKESVPPVLVNKVTKMSLSNDQSHLSSLELKRDEYVDELSCNVEQKKSFGKKQVDLHEEQQTTEKFLVAEDMIATEDDNEVFEENESYLNQLTDETASKISISKIPRPIAQQKSLDLGKVPPSKIPVPIGKRAPSPSTTRKSPPSPSPNRKAPPSPPSNRRAPSPSRTRRSPSPSPLKKSIDEKEPPVGKSIDRELVRKKSVDDRESLSIEKAGDMYGAPVTTKDTKQPSTSVKGVKNDESESVAQKIVKEKALPEPTEKLIDEVIDLLEEDLRLVEKNGKETAQSKPKPVVEEELVVGNAVDVFQDNTGFYDSMVEDSPSPSITSNSPRASITEGGEHPEDSRYDNMLDNISSIMKEMEEEKLLLALLSNVQREAYVEFSHTPGDREDELGVRPGDIVQNIIHQENGWSEGELKGKRGIFPTSCLDMVEELYKTKPQVDTVIDRSEVEAAMDLSSLELERPAVESSGKPKTVVKEAFEEPRMDGSLESEPILNSHLNTCVADDGAKAKLPANKAPAWVKPEIEEIFITSLEPVIKSPDLVNDTSTQSHFERMRRLNEAFDECRQPEPIVGDTRETRPTEQFLEMDISIGTPEPKAGEAIESKQEVKKLIEIKPEEVKKPVESKPEVKKHVESKPEVKKPVETEPKVKEPVESKLEIKKPVESKPEVKKPVESKPDVKKPVESKPDVKKPVESKPEVKKSIESKAEVKKSIESEAEVKKTVESRSEVKKPFESKPEVKKPFESKPEIKKPVEPKPEVRKPVEPKPEVKKPVEPKPEFKKPVEPKPEVKKPIESKPEVKSVQSKPEVKKPVEPEPENKKHVEPKPEFKKPSETKPEAKKPSETKPEVKKPVEPKPEVKKPVEPKPEVKKPVEPKPEVKKLVEPKPEVKKPVEPKPEVKKSVQSKPEVKKPVEPKPEVEKPVEPKPEVKKSVQSKPEVKKPVEPEPEVKKPVEPKPEFRKPSEMKPEARKPSETKPEVKKPVEPKPEVKKHVEPKPEVKKAVEPTPEVKKPVDPKPEVKKPVEPRPEVKKPIEPKPEIKKPVEPEPEVKKPVAPKPEVMKPVAPKPEVKKPVESKPEVQKPVESKSEVQKPVERKHAVKKPVEPKPEVKKPVEPKPEVKKPVESKPEVKKPVESKSEVKKPVEPKHAVKKPVEPKPDVKKPVESKSEVKKPVEPKPAVKKPVEPKPEVKKGREAKPVVTKSVESKPLIEQAINTTLEPELESDPSEWNIVQPEFDSDSDSDYEAEDCHYDEDEDSDGSGDELKVTAISNDLSISSDLLTLDVNELRENKAIEISINTESGETESIKISIDSESEEEEDFSGLLSDIEEEEEEEETTKKEAEETEEAADTTVETPTDTLVAKQDDQIHVPAADVEVKQDDGENVSSIEVEKVPDEDEDDALAEYEIRLTMTQNRGYSKTCTINSLSKAICALYPNAQLNLQFVSDCVNQVYDGLDGVFPEEYHSKSIKVVKQDQPGTIHLNVEQCDVEFIESRSAYLYTYVAIYFDGEDYQSIYVQRKVADSFMCLDNWDENTQVKIAASQVHYMYRVATQWVPDPELDEPEVQDLTYGDISKITNKLDRHLLYNNWYTFGMTLAEQYGDRILLEKGEVEDLYIFHCGGISPANNFLEAVKSLKPRYKMFDFRMLAIKLKRMDIYIETEDWPGPLLVNMTTENQIALSRLLDKSSASTRDWKHFADALGFKNDEIKHIHDFIKRPGKASPSAELFHRLETRAPTFKLSLLQKIFEDISRNDVVEIIEKSIERHKNKQLVEAGHRIGSSLGSRTGSRSCSR